MRAMVVALALSIAAPAMAQSPGDWRNDKPGHTRRINLAALPPPFLTQSAGNAPQIVHRPAGVMPKVPVGDTVTAWASLDAPRAIRALPNGDVLVAETAAGRVMVLRPNGDRASVSVFASGLDGPFGMAVWPPASANQGPPRYLFIGEEGRVVRFPFALGDLHPTGPAQVVVRHLPTGGHSTRDLAVAPDGSRLFVSVGSGSNAGTGMPDQPPGGVAAWEAAHGLGATWGSERGRATVEWFTPEDGTLHPYANGIRNCAGLAVQPTTGAVWCATNERDGLGDDLPPDYATSVREGGFYGWPWYYMGAHADPRFDHARPDLAAKVIAPDVPLSPHNAPLGIAFGPDGSGYVTLHGSWNRATRSGYKLVRLPMRGDRPTGEIEDVMTGLVLNDDEVYGRPVGVAVTADGTILVTDDASGTVWRIARKS